MKAVGVAGVLLFLVLVGRFWDPVYGWTSFLQLDASNDATKIAAFRRLPVYVYRTTGGYDGFYYAQLAYHPLLDAPELRTATDSLAYRARRILPSALAWLGAAGRPDRIVGVYAALNVGAWLVLAALLWRVLAVGDLRGAIGWAGVLFSAGALASVRLALTDLIAATLIVGSLWAVERRRGGAALGWLAAAGLSRETALLAAFGLTERPWVSAANLRRLLTAAAPLVLWLAYVRLRVGPGEVGVHNFAWPLAGIAGKGVELFHAWSGPTDPALVAVTLLATLGLVLQAGWIALRRTPDDPWWRVGAAYVVLMACLGPPVWEGFPGAAPRVLLPLTVAFNVLAVRRRLALPWLVAANLPVCAGLLALLDVPRDPHKLATARVGHEAILVQTDAAWFELEHSPRHTWAWTRQGGAMNFQAWPAASCSVRVTFGVRSLDARTVVIRDRGRLVWRGAVNSRVTEVTLPVRLDSGRALLEFATDTAPVSEGAAAGGRSLGFAVYDVQLGALPPSPSPR
jgi:hypothetical protein